MLPQFCKLSQRVLISASHLNYTHVQATRVSLFSMRTEHREDGGKVTETFANT